MSLPDAHIITAAFAAGSVAALAQALIPFYTGHIIDAAALESRRSDFNRYTVRVKQHPCMFVCRSCVTREPWKTLGNLWNIQA